MNKLFSRCLAAASFLFLTVIGTAPLASAHVIKHSHSEPVTYLKTVVSHKHIVNHSYPAPTPAVKNKIKVNAPMCVTGTSWLNARSGPSTKHEVLAELGEGQRIHISTCSTTNYGKTFWCKTDLGYGKTAFVSKKFLGACELVYRDHKW